MVNTGLRPQSTYEQVAAQVELDDFRVKTPNRAPKFLLESLELQQISPANEEDIIAFENRKREQEARQAEIQRVAQARGVSHVLLDQATSERRVPTIDLENDDFEQRRYANSLEAATANWLAATSRVRNTRALSEQLRQRLGEAHRQQPHVRVGARNMEPEFFDLASEPPTPPNEVDIDLHTPAVPRASDVLYHTVAGGGQLALAAGGAALRNAPAAIETVAEATRLVQQYGPDVAMGALSAAGVSAQALGAIASGVARGTLATGSAVSSAVATAGHVLAVAAPSHRGTDFQRANGVQFASRVAQGLLARHATALL